MATTAQTTAPAALRPGVFAVGTMTVRVERDGRTIVRAERVGTGRARRWIVVELTADDTARAARFLPRA